jgi:hypothetical protein
MNDSRLQSKGTVPSGGWQKVVARMARMDRREMLERGRQELSKRTDVILSGFGFDFARGAISADAAKQGRFFFDPESVASILGVLRQRCPQQVEQIQRQADKICNHRFDLLGYEDLDFGDPIDWYLDAVHSKRAPREPFHKIRFLDFGEVGDSKIIWELSRHHHLVTLAKAYRLTGDWRYVEELRRQWSHWHAQNPYPIGINWASSLEVAFRSLCWMWVFHLLEGSPALSPDFRGDWLRAQALSGRHIERYLSTYFSPNTHLLGEGVALFFIGTLCPELKSAAVWKQQGWQIVLQESERQVQTDGLHFEQSIYYHVYALDFFLHARILASRNGMAIPEEFDRTLTRMLEALCWLGRAGVPPRFGDDDGGRVFDPRRNRGEHLLDPLATGAALFERGDFKFLAGGLREETIWLLGPDAVAPFDELSPVEPSFESVALVSSGLYLMADSKTRQQVVIDAGAQRTATAGHSHADALSVCLSRDGHNLLIDPGTFEYVGDGPERNDFRGTSAHNTLRVDGLDQAEPQNPFAWTNLTETKAERWITGEAFDYFVGSHDGYCRLSSPVVHRRFAFSLKSRLCLVRDVAEGSGEHRLEILWHLEPELQHKMELKNHSFVSADNGITLLTAEGHGWTEEVVQQFWSPAYGRKEPAPVARFSTTAKLPAEFVTLFLPHRGSATEPGALARIQGSTAAVCGYRQRGGDGEHYFLFGPGEQRWSLGPWTSDVEFIYLGLNPDGRRELIFCHGSYVEIGGRPIVSCAAIASRCEIVESNGEATIFSDIKLVRQHLRLEDISLESEPVLWANGLPGPKSGPSKSSVE